MLTNGFIVEILFLIRQSNFNEQNSTNDAIWIPVFQDVHVMIFIGFGHVIMEIAYNLMWV